MLDSSPCSATSIKNSVQILLVALATSWLSMLPSSAATIVVDEQECTLVNAILAANSDSPVGGCSAGDGADTILLTVDITLTEPYSTGFGGTGVPSTGNDEITILGGHHTIERADGAPLFRFMADGGSGVTLEDLTLTNFSTDGDGGALFTPANLHLNRVTLTGNSARNGGAIHSAGFVTLDSCVVTGNSALLDGGGVSGSAIVLTNSTVSHNTAGNDGGGVLGTVAGLRVTNSTVSSNSAGNNGGGIATAWPYDGQATLRSSTVAGNSAGVSGGGIYWGPGILVEDSIFADNGTAGSCPRALVPGANDLGNNFDDDGTCGSGVDALTGFVSTLANNGGLTPTHALLPDSSAMDAAGDFCLATDQRGAPRNDGSCDSGAYEFQCYIEVSDAPTGTAITYTPASSAFDLVAGSLLDLRSDGDYSDAGCVGTSFSGLALDTDPGPPAGDGRYYLARGLDRCVGADYGDSSLDPDPRDSLTIDPCP